MKKYKCPCCGNFTLYEKPPGTYEICEVCNWEDDEMQFKNPNYAGGANMLSLEDAKKEYLKSRKM
ncbi:MAG: hydrolase [Ruminococcus flavefaciens]|nr:hydrolase [Ruminococcus flavefaciens]